MKYNELTLKTSTKKNRVGRGISAGQGKTAGRGTKGQSSRAGSGKKEGFEGGQTPIMKRTPKSRGFRSHRAKAEVVYTGQLEGMKGAITNESLHQAGLVSTAFSKVKLINKGELKSPVAVALQGASESAKASLQKAGGSFVKVERPSRVSAKTKD